MNHKLRNILQNIAIFLLSLSAVFLFISPRMDSLFTFFQDLQPDTQFMDTDTSVLSHIPISLT